MIDTNLNIPNKCKKCLWNDNCDYIIEECTCFEPIKLDEESELIKYLNKEKKEYFNEWEQYIEDFN